MDNAARLQAWIDHVFDHPVAEERWHFGEDVPEWPGPREEIPILVAETFERAGELLGRFDDVLLDQGFWYLAGCRKPEFVKTLVDEEIPRATQFRALRSFVPLFEQIMAVRCIPCLGEHDKFPASPLSASPLASSCYMWWDLLRDNLWHRYPPNGGSETVPWTDFHDEIIATLRILHRIPNDTCRGSALHGIGHLSRDYPERRNQFSMLIEEFLSNTPELRPDLAAYAECARVGEVL